MIFRDYQIEIGWPDTKAGVFGVIDKRKRRGLGVFIPPFSTSREEIEARAAGIRLQLRGKLERQGKSALAVEGRVSCIGVEGGLRVGDLVPMRTASRQLSRTVELKVTSVRFAPGHYCVSDL